MRRLTLSLAAAALGLGAVLGASTTAAAAQQPVIPADLCIAGGGQVVQDGTPPTGYKCQGGDFNGFPVLP